MFKYHTASTLYNYKDCARFARSVLVLHCHVIIMQKIYRNCQLQLTMVAPLGGLSSITRPMPASSSILLALTAPSLFPLYLNLLVARRALMYSIFPGSRRQKAATSLSWEIEPLATCCEAITKLIVLYVYTRFSIPAITTSVHTLQ